MTDTNDMKEITEAINAANDALFHLGNAEEYLKSAKRWGVADIIGGGMIITGVKHAKADNASKELNAANTAIQRLEKSLSDLKGMIQIDVEISSTLLTVTDFLFDNIITDIISQSRMSEAQRQIHDAISQIEGVLDALEEYVA